MAHGPSCSASRGIFPDQGSNPCTLHWQADSQPLRHQGSPVTVVLIAMVSLLLRITELYFLLSQVLKHLHQIFSPVFVLFKVEGKFILLHHDWVQHFLGS